MDRNIVYPGAIPLDTDALTPQVDAMVALGWLLQSVMGTNTGVVGLPCAPTSPASMVVNVGPGAIWSLEEIDTTAFGSLAADTSSLMKMGINKEAAGTNFTLTAPGTSGDSINYLIEAAFSETDGTPVVLPYYNSANPTQPFSGPNNSGTSQNTVRAQSVALQLKAGAAAPTGTQTTPAVDSGYVGLYVITVAYGQSSVMAGNIAAYGGTTFVGPSLLQATQNGSLVYANDTSATANTITLALTPPITAYTDGMVIGGKIANSVTGAARINAGGGLVSFVTPAGAFQGGELPAGSEFTARYVAASNSFVLLNSTAGALAVNPATESNHAVNLNQFAHYGGANTSNSSTNDWGAAFSFTPSSDCIVLVNGNAGIDGSTMNGAKFVNLSGVTLLNETANWTNSLVCVSAVFKASAGVAASIQWNATSVATGLMTVGTTYIIIPVV